MLVADITTPDWEPVMKTAAALVTNRGGRTCHAAIIARELGIPAVVGTGDGTTDVVSGQTVTVSCAEGDTGRVYQGEVPFTVEHTEVAELARPATEIMINLGNPDLAFKTSISAQRRRRPGPHGVHHQRVDQGATRSRCSTPTRSATQRPAHSWHV